MWNTKKRNVNDKEMKTIRRQRKRKRKRNKKGNKKRLKRNSISVAEETIAWEDPATDPSTDPATDPSTDPAAKRANIKKQRSIVDHMKRLHSRFKSKKYKKRRERILFALKVFGGIVITAAEVAFIFA